MKNNIKEYRTALRMTQEDLADKAGCTARAIRNYETGTQIPNAHRILRIAKTLNKTVEELFPT